MARLVLCPSGLLRKAKRAVAWSAVKGSFVYCTVAVLVFVVLGAPPVLILAYLSISLSLAKTILVQFGQTTWWKRVSNSKLSKARRERGGALAFARRNGLRVRCARDMAGMGQLRVAGWPDEYARPASVRGRLKLRRPRWRRAQELGVLRREQAGALPA